MLRTTEVNNLKTIIVELLKEQSEIIKLAHILLVMLAYNMVSERAFSTMREIKNYMRTNST